MSRLTLTQQLLGTERAIQALRKKRRGPVWLIPSLEKHAESLKSRIAGKSSASGFFAFSSKKKSGRR